MERQAYEYFAQDRRARRHGRGGQARTTRSARSPTRRSSSSARSTAASAIVVGVNDYTRGRRRRDRDPAHRPGARAQADRPRAGASAPAATAPRSRRRWPRSSAAAAATTRNLMPALLDCARVHASEGEIVEALQDGLRHLHRDAGLLSRPERSRPCASCSSPCSSPPSSAVARHPGARRDAVGQGRRRLLRAQGLRPTVTVKKGTTVTWRWSGKELHNVAVTKGPVKFRSSYKDSGTYSKRLTRTGTYTIVCTIHQPGHEDASATSPDERSALRASGALIGVPAISGARGAPARSRGAQWSIDVERRSRRLQSCCALGAGAAPAGAKEKGLQWEDCGDGFQCAHGDGRRRTTTSPGTARCDIAVIRKPATERRTGSARCSSTTAGPGGDGVQTTRDA